MALDQRLQIGVEPIDLLTLNTNTAEVPADIRKLSQNEITMAQFDATIKKIALAVHKSPKQVKSNCISRKTEAKRRTLESWKKLSISICNIRRLNGCR